MEMADNANLQIGQEQAQEAKRRELQNTVRRLTEETSEQLKEVRSEIRKDTMEKRVNRMIDPHA